MRIIYIITKFCVCFVFSLYVRFICNRFDMNACKDVSIFRNKIKHLNEKQNKQKKNIKISFAWKSNLECQSYISWMTTEPQIRALCLHKPNHNRSTIFARVTYIQAQRIFCWCVVVCIYGCWIEPYRNEIRLWSNRTGKLSLAAFVARCEIIFVFIKAYRLAVSSFAVISNHFPLY